MKKLCITSGLIASVGLFGTTTLADGPQTSATPDNAGIGLLTQTRNAAVIPPAPAGKVLCEYDNYFDRKLDDFGSPASQKDTVYPFWAEAADDFVLVGDPANGCDLFELFFNVATFGTPGGVPVDPNVCWAGVKVTVYEDAADFCGPGFLKGPAGEPIDLPGGDRQHVEYCPGGVHCELKVPMSQVLVSPKQTTCTPDGFSFDVHVIGLNDPGGQLCKLEKNHKYWMAISPVQSFAQCGQIAIGLATNNFGHPAQQIFLLLGLPWTPIPGNADACPPDTPPAGTARDLAIMIIAKKQCDPPPSCPWDLNCDGVINAADLAIVLGGWDNPYGPADLARLLGGWGPCP